MIGLTDLVFGEGGVERVGVTIFGGLANALPTKQAMATSLNVPITYIETYEIIGEDVHAGFVHDYKITAYGWQKDNLTFIDDIGERLTVFTTAYGDAATPLKLRYVNLNGVKNLITSYQWRLGSGNVLKEISAKNLTYIGSSVFYQNQHNFQDVYYFPNCRTMGGNALYNQTFYYCSPNAYLYVHLDLATANNGNWDDDLIRARDDRGVRVRFCDNFISPEKPVIESVTEITNNSAKLNVTCESENEIEYYNVYVDGVFVYRAFTDLPYVRNLEPNKTYSVSVIAVDYQYNKSVMSDPVNFTTVNTKFVSTWKTDNTGSGSTANNQVKLPLDSIGTYNFTVFWGDGTSNVITTWNQAEVTHTYAAIGTYTITIEGVIKGFRFVNTGDKLKILSVLSWGSLQLANNSQFFYGCQNLNLDTVSDTLNLWGLTSLANMFWDCRKLTRVNRINEWLPSNITSFADMFREAWLFNQDLSFDTRSATSLARMLYTAREFNSETNFDTSRVTSFDSMFQNALKFNRSLNHFNFGSATGLTSLFQGATLFNHGNEPVRWNIPKVTGFSGVFRSTAFNQPLELGNATNITSLNYTFYDCKVFNQPIDSLKTTKCNTFTQTFLGAWVFNQPLPAEWENSATTFANAVGTFYDAKAFNQPINLNFAGTTTLTDFLRGATAFNQPIGHFNISLATTMLNFMLGKTAANYSAEYLDDIYIQWASRPVRPNVNINFGSIKRTSASTAARAILTGAPNNWVITDGGI